MTCLAGAVEETQYAVPPAEEDPELLTPRSPAKRPLAVPGVIASLAPCPPLRRGRTAQLLPGQTAYISDQIVRCRQHGTCLFTFAAPLAAHAAHIGVSLRAPSRLASQALHAVGCAGGSAGCGGGVTLHLYAPPIRRAKLYESAENRVTLRHPGFYSAAGVPLAGDGAVPGRLPPGLRQGVDN